MTFIATNDTFKLRMIIMSAIHSRVIYPRRYNFWTSVTQEALNHLYVWMRAKCCVFHQQIKQPIVETIVCLNISAATSYRQIKPGAFLAFNNYETSDFREFVWQNSWYHRDWLLFPNSSDCLFLEKVQLASANSLSPPCSCNFFFSTNFSAEIAWRWSLAPIIISS